MKTGTKKPFNVKYWCVGNEMFGDWQLGFMQLKQYTIKHNQVAKAMWETDPDLVLVGVGSFDTINEAFDPDSKQRHRTWSRGMLEDSAEWMTMLSEHFYVGRVPWSEDGRKTCCRTCAHGKKMLSVNELKPIKNYRLRLKV